MILITGATGHLGTVLVRRLAQAYPNEPLRVFLQPGEQLDAFDGLTLSLCFGDIRDLAAVTRAVSGARLVFHLAGLIDTAPRKPALLFDVNVNGTQNVVTACLQAGVERLVYTSSVHALPDDPEHGTITEDVDFPVDGLNGPYAQSKTRATAVILEAVQQGLDAVVVFPSGVIGPHDLRRSEMGRLFRYLSGQGWLKLVLSFEGAYNFVDVRDVVEGLVSAAQTAQPGQTFILSGHRIAMRDIIRLERSLLGQRQPKIIFAPRWLVQAAAWLTDVLCRLLGLKPFFTPYSVDVLVSNSQISHDKATQAWGYQPRPLEETLGDTLTWMAQNGRLKGKRKDHQSVNP